MVLYELLSNVASSEQGLRDHPSCGELVDTFRAMGVSARFIRQVHQESDEINLAGQFAQGVRVRGTALKMIRPEAHVKGCVAWIRALLGHVDRGLHVDVTKIRATNAVPLVLGMVLRREHRVFLTGLEEEPLVRLQVEPDVTLKTVPKALAANRELLDEYLARRQRTSSFLTQAQDVATLEFLDAGLRDKLRKMARDRDGGAIDSLTDAEVVNIGLMSEYIERYQSIFEQFTAMFHQGELTAELAAHFEVLTQGISYVEARAALEHLTHEETRSRIADKRSLINELRISLAQGAEALHDEFRHHLRSLVLKQRLKVDAALYRKVIRLPAVSPEDVEALGPFRAMLGEFKAIHESVRGAVENARGPAPVPMKQKLFEVLLKLTFDSQFNSRIDESRLQAGPLTARRLLSQVELAVYDIGNLRKINSRLPIRGVALNLAEKVPVTWVEFDVVVARLSRALFPLGDLAKELGESIRVRLKEEDEQRKVEAVRQYLNHGNLLLGLTNYVLGRARLTTEEWSALLEGGRALGLPVLSSRDQIRNDKALRQVQQGLTEHLEGYVLLLNDDKRALFPVEAEPVVLRAAFQHLVDIHVVRTARRFFFQKLQVLAKQHGNRFFEMLYRHVRRQGGLTMSRSQFGRILLRHRVFERTRFRELGFISEAMANGDVDENPWLLAAASNAIEEDAQSPFATENVAAAHAKALTAFRKVIAGYPGQDGDGAGESLSLDAALGALAREGVYDLGHPGARELLSKTPPAAMLWKVVQQAISKSFKTVLSSARSTQEAIEVTLPGRMAYLAYLKPDHVFKAGEHSLLFRLVPDLDASPETLDAASAPVVQGLSEHLGNGAAGASPLARSLSSLETHFECWNALREASMVPLVDQILRETLLKSVRPIEPMAEHVSQYPEEAVLCIGVSSSDQGKFHRVVERIDHENVYATLSEVASWLARFQRLDDELEAYRGMIDDVRKQIDNMNFTVWDAPYLTKYRAALTELHETMDLRPEHVTQEDLTRIENLARDIGEMVRDIHTQEQQVRPRDRWLNRIATRLKTIRPESQLIFVDRLHEGSERSQNSSDGEEEDEPKQASVKDGKEKEFQTFSERMRNVIGYRERLAGKEVFVLSPSNTQRALTLSLIDRIFALKGLFTPILVDVSGCQSFVPLLRTRLPPHRLFDLNRL